MNTVLTPLPPSHGQRYLLQGGENVYVMPMTYVLPDQSPTTRQSLIPMPETQDHENDEPIDQHDSADPTVVPSSELSEPVVPEPPTVNEQDSALTHTADTERSDDTEPDDEAAQKEAAALLAAQHAAAQAIEEALAAERQHEVRGNEDLDVTVRVRHDDSPAVPEDHSTETKPEPPAAKPKPKAEETDEADNVDKADTQDDDSGTKNDSAESDDDTATHEKHTDSGSKTTKNNDQDDSPATETIEPVAPAPPRTPSAEVDSDTPGNSDENPEQPDSPDVDTGTAETDADAGGNADLDTEHSTDETTEAGGSGEGGGHDGNDHGGDHGEGTGDGEEDSATARIEKVTAAEDRLISAQALADGLAKQYKDSVDTDIDTERQSAEAMDDAERDAIRKFKTTEELYDGIRDLTLEERLAAIGRPDLAPQGTPVGRWDFHDTREAIRDPERFAGRHPTSELRKDLIDLSEHRKDLIGLDEAGYSAAQIQSELFSNYFEHVDDGDARFFNVSHDTATNNLVIDYYCFAPVKQSTFDGFAFHLQPYNYDVLQRLGAGKSRDPKAPKDESGLPEDTGRGLALIVSLTLPNERLIEHMGHGVHIKFVVNPGTNTLTEITEIRKALDDTTVETTDPQADVQESPEELMNRYAEDEDSDP